MVGTTFLAARPPSKARLKRLVAIGNGLALALGLWTIFFAAYAYALSLALCFALPIVALAIDIRAQGALDFEQRRSRRSPLSLATILIMPALALALRAGLDLNFNSYLALMGETAIAMAAIIVLFLRLVPTLKGDVNQLTNVGIFALAYSFGVLAFADVTLDPSTGHDAQTILRAKRIHASGGPKGSSVWYRLKVDADASPAGAGWIHVRPDLWRDFARGDTVCVHTGPGLLGAAWYTVRPCVVISPRPR